MRFLIKTLLRFPAPVALQFALWLLFWGFSFAFLWTNHGDIFSHSSHKILNNPWILVSLLLGLHLVVAFACHLMLTRFQVRVGRHLRLQVFQISLSSKVPHKDFAQDLLINVIPQALEGLWVVESLAAASAFVAVGGVMAWVDPKGTCLLLGVAGVAAFVQILSVRFIGKIWDVFLEQDKTRSERLKKLFAHHRLWKKLGLLDGAVEDVLHFRQKQTQLLRRRIRWQVLGAAVQQPMPLICAAAASWALHANGQLQAISGVTLILFSRFFSELLQDLIANFRVIRLSLPQWTRLQLECVALSPNKPSHSEPSHRWTIAAEGTSLQMSGSLRQLVTLWQAPALGAEQSWEQTLEHTLRRVGLGDKALDKELSADGGGLSAGEWQRLELARALFWGAHSLSFPCQLSSCDAELRKDIWLHLHELG